MDLPDSVWLKIMSYLSADCLLNLSNLTEEQKICSSFNKRLYELSGDKSLWKSVNFKGKDPNELRKMIKFLGSDGSGLPEPEGFFQIRKDPNPKNVKIRIVELDKT